MGWQPQLLELEDAAAEGDEGGSRDMGGVAPATIHHLPREVGGAVAWIAEHSVNGSLSFSSRSKQH